MFLSEFCVRINKIFAFFFALKETFSQLCLDFMHTKYKHSSSIRGKERILKVEVPLLVEMEI